MSIFSKLFKSNKSTTLLEEFLSTFTIEQSKETYHSTKNESARFPAALSVWVMFLANGFSTSLRDMLSEIEKKIRRTNDKFPYDAVTFEAAAYCYYWLMRDALNSDDEEFDNVDENLENESYFEYMKVSAHVTNSIINGKVQFDLSNNLIMKRIMAYSHEEKFEIASPKEKFSQFLISSIQSRSPQLKSNVNIESSLPLQLSVASYIPIFETTLLSEFKKSARVMFLSHQEGTL